MNNKEAVLKFAVLGLVISLFVFHLDSSGLRKEQKHTLNYLDECVVERESLREEVTELEKDNDAKSEDLKGLAKHIEEVQSKCNWQELIECQADIDFLEAEWGACVEQVSKPCPIQ